MFRDQGLGGFRRSHLNIKCTITNMTITTTHHIILVTLKCGGVVYGNCWCCFSAAACVVLVAVLLLPVAVILSREGYQSKKVLGICGPAMTAGRLPHTNLSVRNPTSPELEQTWRSDTIEFMA